MEFRCIVYFRLYEFEYTHIYFANDLEIFIEVYLVYNTAVPKSAKSNEI